LKKNTKISEPFERCRLSRGWSWPTRRPARTSPSGGTS